MFYEYALLPDLFDHAVVDDRALGVIVDQLLAGIVENGMVANLNKDKWLRYVREVLLPTVMDPESRARIVSRLEVLDNRHRLVRHPAYGGRTASMDDWLSVAMESHSRVRFDGLFLCEDLLQRSGLSDSALVELSTALGSLAWTSRRRTLPVKMVEAEFRRVLTPVLRHARSVTLVDPYLSPETPRFWTTVVLVAELTGARGYAQQRDARIQIQTGDPTNDPSLSESPSDRLDRWEHALKSLNARIGVKHRYSVFLWRPKPGGRKLHDRYVLTDQVGIQTPGGLDCQNPASANVSTWAVLDEPDRVLHLEEYDPKLSPFQFLAMREIGS